ncbi:MAG TPA: 6,7-dimethyl-8-ribityllumazine synthase [Fimbriimonadaceae bacterium]
MVKSLEGQMDGKGKRFAVIVSRWNELVTKELLEGALELFKRHGDPDVEVIHVPGTWEIPVAARALLSRDKKRPDAIVALGCILQGQTPHAKLLGSDVGGALMGLQVETGVPIAWGVLTPDNQEQALDRAGLKHGNKGREAASAAIEMAAVVSEISKA